MENKISFSELIKNEILEHNWSDSQLGILFYSFLRTNGTYKEGAYVVTTTLVDWEPFFTKCFKKFYKITPRHTRSKTQIKYTIFDPLFLDEFTRLHGNILVENLEENKAYLAGIFVGKGWISEPTSRFYHCEVRVRHLSQSLDVQEAFDGVGIKVSTLKKKGWFYTYIKKSTDISKLIALLNAPNALMLFEDQRIERDFMASYMKMQSIEEYNIGKTQVASKAQVKAIEKLISKDALKVLPEKKRRIAELRIELPEYTFSELQMEYNQRYGEEVSRSTISNWLSAIVKIEGGV